MAEVPAIPEAPSRVYLVPPAGSPFRPGYVDAAKAPSALKQGWSEGKAPEAGPAAPSALETAAEHAGNAALAHFGDEAYGAAAGAFPAALKGANRREIAAAYARERDAARARLAAGEQANPRTAALSDLAGSVAGAALVPGGAIGQAVLGGLDAAGRAEHTPAPSDVASGALLGLGGGIAGEALGAGIRSRGAKATAGASRAAAQSAANVLGHSPQALGEALPSEAVDVMRRAAESGAVPTSGRLTPEAAVNAAAPVRRQLGERLSQLYHAFDALHGPSVDPGALLARIHAATEKAVLIRPELATHVRDVVRLIAPEEYAVAAKATEKAQAAEARASAETASAGAQNAAAKALEAARAAGVTRPLDPTWWRSWAPPRKLTLHETQEAVNRIAQLGDMYAADAAPGIVPVGRVHVTQPAHAAARGALAQTAQSQPGPLGPAIGAARAQFGPVAAVHDAAAALAARAPVEAPGAVHAAQAMGQAAKGAVVGGLLGGPAGAAGAATSALGGAHGIAQRVPTLLGAASRAIPGVANSAAHAVEAATPVTARLAGVNMAGSVPSAAGAGHSAPHASAEPSQPGTHNHALHSRYGAVMAGKTPDQRRALDLKLQEISPAYRERRQKALAEEQASGAGS